MCDFCVGKVLMRKFEEQKEECTRGANSFSFQAALSLHGYTIFFFFFAAGCSIGNANSRYKLKRVARSAGVN